MVTAKSAAKSTKKPATKKTSKPAGQSAVKKASKSAAKPASKSRSKSASKPASESQARNTDAAVRTNPFELDLSPELADVLRRAADLAGQPMMDFILENARRAAENTTLEHKPLGTVKRSGNAASAIKSDVKNERARIIEIMGLPAVGKSTILEKAYEMGGDRWIPQSQLDALSKGSEINYSKMRAVVDGREFATFLEQSIDFINQTSMSCSQKMTAIRMLDRTARNYSAMMLLEGPALYVCDELFAHRAFATLIHSDSMDEQVDWYFAHCPLPAAVILFKDKHEDVVARLVSRKQPLNTFRGLTQDEIKQIYQRSDRLYALAEEKMRSRGTTVYELAVEPTIEASAEKFLTLISKFENQQ
jgi:hypothetical protein